MPRNYETKTPNQPQGPKDASPGRKTTETAVRMKELKMNSNSDKADHVIFFDLETQKLADEVGGWKYVSRMKMSIAVTCSTIHGFKTFTERERG